MKLSFRDNVSDYEPVGDGSQDSASAVKLQSPVILSKMKDRPLPAPPRPPRDRKSREKTPHKSDSVPPPPPPTDDESKKPGNDEPKDDFDAGAEVLVSAIDRQLQADSSFESNTAAARSIQAGSSFESQYSYRVDEIDSWVQTDPLPDDFQLEDLEITDDMRTITPTKFREGCEHFEFSSSRVESRPETPSIEQELQRLQNRVSGSAPSSRPASRPSSRVSVKSRGSSRPTTPALVYVERKISTPLIDGEQVEASLTVQPVEIDEETGDVIIVSDITPLDRLREIQEAIDQREQAPVEEPAVPVRKSREIEQSPPERPPKPSPPRVAPPIPPLPTEIATAQPQEIAEEPQIEELPPVAPPRGQPVTQPIAPETLLHVTNLEVDRLSVNSLEASRINVTELDDGSSSVRNIQIPPSLIEEIVEQVTRRTSAMQRSMQRPPTTPEETITPRQVLEEFSIPPASFYRLTNPQQPAPQQLTQPPEPSISQLTGQLATACGSALSRQGRNLMNYLRSASKDEHRRDLHFVLFILIVIIAGLFMMGMDHSDRQVHHYHWDYFNPPGNSGRPN